MLLTSEWLKNLQTNAILSIKLILGSFEKAARLPSLKHKIININKNYYKKLKKHWK